MTILRVVLLLFVVVLLSASTTGCVTVRFNQKKRLAEAEMQLDPNPLTTAFAGKVLASREGAVGGYHTGGAGGCGCN